MITHVDNLLIKRVYTKTNLLESFFVVVKMLNLFAFQNKSKNE